MTSNKKDELQTSNLADLSLRNKELVLSAMMATTVAIDMLAHIRKCTTHEVIEQVQILVAEKFGNLSDEDIEKAIADITAKEQKGSHGKICTIVI